MIFDKNYWAGKRLFINKAAKMEFLEQSSYNKREACVRQVDAIKHNTEIKNHEEVERRRENLKRQGLIAPNNIKECNEMIRDLRKWRIRV